MRPLITISGSKSLIRNCGETHSVAHLNDFLEQWSVGFAAHVERVFNRRTSGSHTAETHHREVVRIFQSDTKFAARGALHAVESIRRYTI